MQGEAMNDKEAFEKWVNDDSLSQMEVKLFQAMTENQRIMFCSERTWQAAVQYKQKEYSNIMDAMTQTSQNNAKLLAENAFLKENINGTKMKQMNDRIEELLVKNKKMREAIREAIDFQEWCGNEYILENALKEVGEE
ncbi:MAG: hypothetical protein RLZ35_446 [Pseudomonadota bacterium]|jgi:hypothetical protein